MVYGDQAPTAAEAQAVLDRSLADKDALVGWQVRLARDKLLVGLFWGLNDSHRTQMQRSCQILVATECSVSPSLPAFLVMIHTFSLNATNA